MSIADQITRLNNAKAAIKQSIENKGVTVSDKALLDEYPALIDSIEVGSGGEGGGDPYFENLFNLRTNYKTDFSNLFNGFSGSELDLSNLDMSNVNTMANMFYGCLSLNKLIGEDKWNTSNVTTMYNMFYNCNALSTIDVFDWDVSKVTDMNSMFAGCYYLGYLRAGDWDTSQVTTMDSMFNACGALTDPQAENWDTSNVTAMSYMFAYCYALQVLDLSKWNTSKVTGMYGMFNWCTGLQKLDISNFELVHEDGTAAEIWGMLEGCTSLRTLRLDNCSNATISKIINESNIDTSAIGGARAIYCKRENAEGLTAPDNWVFSFVGEEGGGSEIIPSYIPGEFRNNTEITEIKTMVDTSHDNLDSMLAGCTSLVSVNTEDWDVSNVNNMYYMFGECRSLTSLNMSNWNTNNVTNMGEMFIRCSSLESLNLSNFDMTNVTNTNYMFQNCTSLYTIRLDNCSNDTISKIITSANFPTDVIDGVTRTIYCKEENAAGLVAPTNWTFNYIE